MTAGVRGRSRRAADDPRRAVGIRIRQLRLRAKWSQTALAEQCVTDGKTVADWEAGRSWPSAPFLIRLAQQLGVSVDYILTGHDFMQPALPVLIVRGAPGSVDVRYEPGP